MAAVDITIAAAAARVRTRREQGLGPTVTDPGAVQAVAAIVRSHPSQASEAAR